MLKKVEIWRFFARLAKATGALFAIVVMPPEIGNAYEGKTF